MRGLLPPSLGNGTLPKNIQGKEGLGNKSKPRKAPRKATTVPMGGGNQLVTVNPTRKLGNK